MWYRTSDTPPPRGEVVQTLSEGGQEQELVYRDGLWFLPDLSMYIYETPMFWKRMGA